MITTTLAALRKSGACFVGYNRLVRSIQGKEFTLDDVNRNRYIRLAYKEEISLEYIAESNGIKDALWTLRASNATERDMRMFAVWCARQVQHLMKDQRSINALDVAERHSNGLATNEELEEAKDAAWAAAWAAERAVERAVERDAAWAAAWAVERVAAYAAERAAAWAAERVAACAVTWAAAWAAERVAAMDAQKEMFILMCNNKAPWQIRENIDEQY